ncbi:MAG: hypothetical protein ABR863_08505 [Roseiarcus sp.]|jgi:hypothetical protein
MAPQASLIYELETWPVERVEEWLFTGMSALVYARERQSMDWLLAFQPLKLNPQDDPADKIISTLSDKRLSEPAYDKARRALGRVLKELPTRIDPSSVQLLMRLAGSLLPSGLAAVARNLLARQVVRDRLDIWKDAFSAAVVALSNYPDTETFSDFVNDLQHTAIWRPIYARYYIRARTVGRPDEWLPLLDEFNSDLVKLGRIDEDSILALAQRLVENCGPRRIAAGLSSLVVGDYRSLRWFADLLIERFEVITEGDGLFLVSGPLRAEIPTNPVGEFDAKAREEWYTFCDIHTPRPSRDAGVAKKKCFLRLIPNASYG